MYRSFLHYESVLTDGSGPNAPTSSWDSIHVFEAAERGRTAHYKLTSTVMLQLTSITTVPSPSSDRDDPSAGNVTLSGSMTRQTEQDGHLSDWTTSHIINTGTLIEDMEIKMRNLLQEVYFGKTRDVVFDLRSVESLEGERRRRELQKELVGLIRR